MKKASLYPSLNELRSAILEALYRLGGTGSLDQAREELESKFTLTQEALNATESTRPTQSLWRHRIRVAKQSLVTDGFMCKREEVGWDVWKLSGKGIETCKAAESNRLSPVTETDEIFLSQGEERLDDFESEDDLFLEGTRLLILVQRAERSTAARNACIDHHKPFCKVCGFDFAEVYGTIGEGFIHVHHLNPLQETNEEKSVDPVNDLVPLCPNCHAMAHRKTPPYTVLELQSIMRAQGAL